MPRFIEFKRQAGDEWDVLNKRHGDYLGCIVWYADWRCYTLEADETAVFNGECLRDIAAFMEDETKKRKAKGAGDAAQA